MDDMYKNQIDYAEIPADAVILDVRNGSEHTEIALRRKHYFVELPQFDAKSFIKDYGLNGEKICVLCKSGFRASKAARMLEEAGYPNVAMSSYSAKFYELYLKATLNFFTSARLFNPNIRLIFFTNIPAPELEKWMV